MLDWVSRFDVFMWGRFKLMGLDREICCVLKLKENY